MSHDQLVINQAALAEAYSAMRTIIGEFDDADANAAAISVACGEGRLAESVRQFASDWDDRREKMTATIENAAALIEAVGEAFKDVEGQLVQALTEPQGTPVAAGSAGRGGAV